jgi:hypothetical protein
VVEDAVAVLVRVDSWPVWEDSARSPEQERADVLQNKLANVICNAELALDMVDGPARGRLEAILRAAWSASHIVATLPLASADPVKWPA